MKFSELGVSFMSINKKMVEKISEKTKNNSTLKEFIMKMLVEESKGLGWYKDRYIAELEKTVKDGAD